MEKTKTRQHRISCKFFSLYCSPVQPSLMNTHGRHHSQIQYNYLQSKLPISATKHSTKKMQQFIKFNKETNNSLNLERPDVGMVDAAEGFLDVREAALVVSKIDVVAALEIDLDEDQTFVVFAENGFEESAAPQNLLKDEIVRRREVVQVVLRRRCLRRSCDLVAHFLILHLFFVFLISKEATSVRSCVVLFSSVLSGDWISKVTPKRVARVKEADVGLLIRFWVIYISSNTKLTSK